MTTTQQSAATDGYSVIGSRPIRHDGTDKVTGRAQYGADIALPGMLYGKVLRSPHAHARIKSIDTSKAEAMPGVHAVVTSADLPQAGGRVLDLGEGAMINPKFLSNNCLAAEKALYKGHAIAAVAADSAHEAELALALIEVDYEVLEPVTDVLEAMRDDAPLVHERLANLNDPSVRPGGLLGEGDAGKVGNVPNRYFYELGDIEAGFAAADLVVEREFRTKAVHQGYIEPHAATALWNADDSLHIWCSSQGHFNVRDQTSTILGIPVSKVLVTQLEIGGGFGGKTLVYLEPVAAVLSRKTGRPVKIQMSRTEVFEGTGPTSGGYMRVKMGVTNDGKITAADVVLFYEAGAYPGSPVNPGAQCALSCYNIANGRIEAADVVLNHPKTAAYRAPGSPAACFAVETVVDEICEKIGMDKLDFRTLNGAKQGDRRVTGPQFGSIGWLETLQALREHDHWNSPIDRSPEAEGKKVGRGVAGGFWFNGAGPASAIVSVLGDGTVSLVEGSPDIGGTRAVAAMHVAEVLGLAAEDVAPSVGDTNSIGWTSMTGGSGVAFKTGWASYEAAQDVKQQMINRAARIWDIDPENVEYDAGVIQHKSEPELRFTFRELASRLNGTGGPIVGTGQRVAHRRGRRLRAAHRRRGGGRGHRQGGHPALHGHPGRRHGHPPVLRGGADPGRRGAGHRLGAERGVLLQRRRPDAELQLPGLPHAHGAGPADDRHRGGGGAQPRASLRRARRGRGAHRAAHGGHRQRHPRRYRRSDAEPAHEPRRGAGSAVGAERRIDGQPDSRWNAGAYNDMPRRSFFNPME